MAKPELQTPFAPEFLLPKPKRAGNAEEELHKQSQFISKSGGMLQMPGCKGICHKQFFN